jgi:hypothetical protein
METRPELSALEARMLSGQTWRLAACSPGCRCVEERWKAESLSEDLARCGIAPRRSGAAGYKRTPWPERTRRKRDLDLLLQTLVATLRPTVDDWCDIREGCGPVYFGVGGPETRVHERKSEWSRSRRQLAEWLDDRAGKQRTPYAIRLRRAAREFEEEDSVDHAISWLLEAALLEAGVGPAVRETLLQAPTDSLSGQQLAEMVYLARAGRRSLRVLAARRLAGATSPQAASTLRQLLWEPYGPLAETALWAISCHDPRSAARACLRVVRGMLEEDSLGLRCSIAAAALTAGEGSEVPDLLLHAYETTPLRPEVCELAQLIAGM